MTPDLLDDLLEHSAPPTRSVPEIDLDAMIADAGGQIPRARRRRVAIMYGALAILLVSGAGIATATDGFTWVPWAQEPVGAVSFTMANGFACELRFSEFTAGDDPAFLSEVNRLLEDWYRSTDVIAAAEGILPGIIEDRRLDEIHLEPGETLESLPEGEGEHRRWAQQWLAWDLAVSQLESDELARRGIEPGDARFVGSERSGQIQCVNERHELYVPGAGS